MIRIIARRETNFVAGALEQTSGKILPEENFIGRFITWRGNNDPSRRWIFDKINAKFAGQFRERHERSVRSPLRRKEDGARSSVYHP